MVYIPRERSLVRLVLITLMAWGRKDTVVHVAAAKPIAVKKSIAYMKNSFRLRAVDGHLRQRCNGAADKIGVFNILKFKTDIFQAQFAQKQIQG